MNNYDFETIKIMLEKALYFYVEHCSEEELREEEEYYNLLTEEHFYCDLEEELIDNMFESYLDNYKGKELEYRINDLFDLDNVSDYGRLIAFRNFLEEENNYDLFELETQNKKNLNKGCAMFLKDNEHLLKVYEGSENGEEDSIIDYETFIKNYSFRVKVI